MCSFWLRVALINVQLVYESAILGSLALISLGWTISRETLTASEWRGLVGAVTGFYISSSIVIVINRNLIQHIANALLYLSMYMYITYNSLQSLHFLFVQTSSLSSHVPIGISKPLLLKREMFFILNLVIVSSLAFEAAAQLLFVASGKIGPILVCCEISSAVFLGLLGYYFQPCEYSPFFFMVATQTAGGEASSDRLLTALTPSEEAEQEVEVTSLVRTSSNRQARSANSLAESLHTPGRHMTH
jgi:hypothetical protein